MGNGGLSFWFDKWSFLGVIAEGRGVQISHPTLRVSDILADRTILRTLNLPQGMVNTLWNLNLSPSNGPSGLDKRREG